MNNSRRHYISFVVLFIIVFSLVFYLSFKEDTHLDIKDGDEIPGEFYHTTIDNHPCVVWLYHEQFEFSCDFSTEVVK